MAAGLDSVAVDLEGWRLVGEVGVTIFSSSTCFSTALPLVLCGSFSVCLSKHRGFTVMEPQRHVRSRELCSFPRAAVTNTDKSSGLQTALGGGLGDGSVGQVFVMQALETCVQIPRTHITNARQAQCHTPATPVLRGQGQVGPWACWPARLDNW